MTLDRFYYRCKPFIPESLRLGMRRMHARRILKQCGASWPIKVSAGRKPVGWNGWPDGKQFAFVLTHDVESELGLTRVRSLAELEMQFGFRSSFNFIPEGPYRVSKDLLNWLTSNGFEVGVHDLNHDGLLYRSRAEFIEKSKRINLYLKEWGADGFRSGFMLKELNWLHALNIQYDASTFDTDPFEPRPQGVHTIFPFWVGNGDGTGYVELPYTLPQDSTIFRLLREPSIAIWKQKLGWIAEHGGMALLDVHPDYTDFGSKRGHPGSAYAEFLEHVIANYSGAYWHVLPRDVAKFYRPTGKLAAMSLTKVNHAATRPGLARILMLVENNFPQDPRVKNEADALTTAGYQVTVVALRKPGQTWTEVVNDVHVYRVPRLEIFRKTALGSSGRIQRTVKLLVAAAGYIAEYFYFTAACFVATLLVALREGFDVIHAHNPPDTLFAVAVPFKLFGKKFIFDHHDLCPELYCSRFRNPNKLIYRILLLVEQFTLRLADVVIATNESYKQIDVRRGQRSSDTVFVVRNGPNAGRMKQHTPSTRLRELGRTIICYVGCLNPQDGVDCLLRSIQHLRYGLDRTDFYCVVMGAGDSLEDLRRLRTGLELQNCLELTGFISEEELLANLAAADICVDPDPSNPLNDQSTWIKIMEYMAFGKPIVSFDLKETRVSAQDAALYVEPNDEMAFARAIAHLMDSPELRAKMGAFGRQRVEQHLQWSVVSKTLVEAYRSLSASLDLPIGVVHRSTS
jgi:glycosyltransferase involved in cell wall biosynthesis